MTLASRGERTGYNVFRGQNSDAFSSRRVTESKCVCVTALTTEPYQPGLKEPYFTQHLILKVSLCHLSEHGWIWPI